MASSSMTSPLPAQEPDAADAVLTPIPMTDDEQPDTDTSATALKNMIVDMEKKIEKLMDEGQARDANVNEKIESMKKLMMSETRGFREENGPDERKL